ncbi:MAG: cupin domain-containing protein [Puniceicoccales bacterium]
MHPVYQPEFSAATQMVMGTTTRFLLTGEQTGGQFTLYRITAGQGDIVPLHVHEYEDETFMVREGQLRVVVAGEVFLASPGDVVFAPRHIAHSWEAVAEGMTTFDLMSTPTGMEIMFQELGALTHDAPMGTVLDICQRAGIRFLPAD